MILDISLPNSYFRSVYSKLHKCKHFSIWKTQTHTQHKHIKTSCLLCDVSKILFLPSCLKNRMLFPFFSRWNFLFDVRHNSVDSTSYDCKNC